MSPNPPKPILKIPEPIPIKVHISHKDQIPQWLHQFIENVVDVVGHVHCRFCAVAGIQNLSVDDH